MELSALLPWRCRLHHLRRSTKLRAEVKSLALLYKYVSAVRFGRRQQHFLYSYSAANHFCCIRGRHNKDRRSTLPSRLPGFVLIIRIAAPPSFFPLFYSTNHHHTQMCNDHTMTTPHVRYPESYILH